MKLDIEKLPHGSVKAELTIDGMKKPVSVQLATFQVDGLIQMLELARRANAIKLTLEVG